MHSIAAVTQAMYSRLGSALARSDLQRDLLIKKAPDKGDVPSIALVLHSVTPNVALRNAELPTWGQRGQIRPAVVPLELRYVLIFVSAGKPLKVHQAMGAILADLHEKPLLTSDDIRDGLSATTTIEANLSGADLHLQKETLKLNPVALDSETASRIWSTFGRSFHATLLAFQVSPLMLEGRGVAGAMALPVKSVGLSAQLSQQPQLQGVAPRVTWGEALSMRGQWPDDANTRALLNGTLVTPSSRSASEMTVSTAGSSAGVVTVEAVRVDSAGRAAARSVPLRTLVCPRLTLPSAAVNVDSDGQRSLTLGIKPTPRVGQSLRLLLNDKASAAAYSLPVAVGGSGTMVVDCSDVPAGTYLARVELEGVSSLLEWGSAGYSGPLLILTGGGS